MKKLVCFAVLLSCVSCASLVEWDKNYRATQRCEETDWFVYGQFAALNGQRPAEDEFKKCEQLGVDVSWADVDLGFKDGVAKYCSPEAARTKGTAGGSTFNYELCDSSTAAQMRKAHEEGLRQFCHPEQAYTFATGGGVYHNQCPKNMDAAYVKSYLKGRKLYLENGISAADAQATSLAQEIEEQKELRNNVTLQLASTPSVQVVTKTKTLDPKTNTYNEESSVEEDPAVAEKRRDLQKRIEGINSLIQNKLQSQNDLRATSSRMRTELTQLTEKI